MPRPLESGGADRPPGGFSPQLAAVLRPELESLAEEILTEVRHTVPAYERKPGKAERPELRTGVHQVLCTFVDRISGSGEAWARRDELCRGLGRGEAYRGRSLDSLQAAYRTGVKVAWRRVAEIGSKHDLSSSVMSQLAEALLAYIDELVSLSVEGYEEARAYADDSRAEARRRLMRVLLGWPKPSQATLERVAEAAKWRIPAEVVPVALPPKARAVRSALGAGVLADLDRGEPHLIIPGPLDEARMARLVAALPERRGAVGPSVPPLEAADSLRWARRTLALMDAGILADTGLARAEDHLLELWLLADQALLDQITRRWLGALSGMGDGQRQRLTPTLGAWLESEGNAVQTAERLKVHPQTVRYRLKQIIEAFGDRLTDPDCRFALEAVLRAKRLRERGRPQKTSPHVSMR